MVLTVLLGIAAAYMHAVLAHTLYQDADRRLKAETLEIEDSLRDYLKDILLRYELLKQNVTSPSFSFLETDLTLRIQHEIRRWEQTGQYLKRRAMMFQIIGVDHTPIVSNLSGWTRGIIFPDFERDSVFMEKGTSYQTIHYRRIPIRLYYHLVTFHQKPLFIIQAALSLQDIVNALNRLVMIILVLIPLAVIAACIAGWFLAKSSFRPIDLMIRQAREISAMNLERRLPRSNRGDELDQLAATLNEMMDRIVSSARAVQEFSSNISHELKTPLAIIRGEVDLALRKPRSLEAMRETLRVIESEVDGLIRLVDDLMLLVRSDAKQLRFQKKEVFLSRLLEEITARFQERANMKEISLSFLPADDTVVLGDDVYLKRLFSNLIDNALKFTPKGGKVIVEVHPETKRVRVDIRDSGIGIPPEIREKVFARFYRADQARGHEGAGLGLSIAQAICEAHQGSLHIANLPPGHGACVSVYLPILCS